MAPGDRVIALPFNRECLLPANKAALVGEILEFERARSSVHAQIRYNANRKIGRERQHPVEKARV